MKPFWLSSGPRPRRCLGPNDAKLAKLFLTNAFASNGTVAVIETYYAGVLAKPSLIWRVLSFLSPAEIV